MEAEKLFYNNFIGKLMISYDNIFQNVEAEKQLKFFQGCVAAAFAERDRSIMEVMTVLKST